MKYKQWERALKKELGVISAVERERTLEYYREMKDEKLSRGESEEEITAEFGSPRDCARRVARENGVTLKERAEEEAAPIRERKEFSAAEIVGLVFATLLLFLPLFVSLGSIVISFAAVSLGGAAISVAGIVFAVGSPFLGASGAAIPAFIGMGLAASGAGILICIGFLFATKYMAIGVKRLFEAIYVRR